MGSATIESPSVSLAALSQEPTTTNPPKRHSADWLGVVGLVIAVALYMGICFHLLNRELSATGTFTFPLDDTYITMALAKNVALHGVWGLGHFGFQSASSCPGFLLLLAGAFRIFGPSEWMPLVFSLSFGIGVILVASRFLAKMPILTQWIALLAIVLFVPLPVLGVLGMEHTLHLLFVLAFLHLFSKRYASDQNPDWTILLLACAMTSVRYESLFIVFPACALLSIRKELRSGISLGASAAAPVIACGVIAAWHGAYWLPASIALKGVSGKAAAHSPMELARHFGTMVGRAPYMGWLLLAMLLLLAVPDVWRDQRCRANLIVVSSATMFHLTLADVGWVYRYEAYLIGAAIAVTAHAVSRVHLRRPADRWLAAACLPVVAMSGWLLYKRTVEAIATIPLRSLAIYCQQIQMARFLSQFESGKVVAANDIGAISYFADIDCVDLIGIANNDVFQLRRRGAYTTQSLVNLAESKHVQLAVVYDSWFSNHPIVPMGGPPLPSSWIRVQRWGTPNGIFLGDGIVSFYATSAAEAASLRDALAQFDETLPHAIKVLD